MLENGTCAVYNCSMSGANYMFFKKFNGVETLLPLRNTPNEKLNMNVLFSLAYIVDDQNNDDLLTSNDGECVRVH